MEVINHHSFEKQGIKTRLEAFTRNGLVHSINQEILLFEGNLELSVSDLEFTLQNGVVQIEWFPTPRTIFIGELNTVTKDIVKCLDNELNVAFNNKLQGKGIVFSKTFGEKLIIKGELLFDELDVRSNSYNEVQFSLVNFPEILGDKRISTDYSFWKGRMEVNIGAAILTIDAVQELSGSLKDLKTQKGYLITHHCRLKFEKLTNGKLVLEYLDSIRLTLRILIGQDLGFTLIDFIKNQNVVTSMNMFGKIKPIEQCHRLINMHSWLSDSVFFDEIFRNLIKGKNDKPISHLIHWYNMANTNQGYVEGSLVLAQVGIELLYNWIICEHLQMVTSKDASEKISAASKLKTLSVYSGINLEDIQLPEELNEYKEKEKKQSNVDLIITLRNHLVHSNDFKRNNLAKYDPIIFYQAKNILLFIIERYLLAIGSYDRKYVNRLDNNLSDAQDFKVHFK
jgi:hypothetical protein